MADNSNLPDSVSEQHLNFTQDGGEPDLCQMEDGEGFTCGLNLYRDSKGSEIGPPDQPRCEEHFYEWLAELQESCLKYAAQARELGELRAENLRLMQYGQDRRATADQLAALVEKQKGEIARLTAVTAGREAALADSAGGM